MLIIGHRWQEHQRACAEMIEVDLRRHQGEIVLSHGRLGKSKQLMSLRQLLAEAKVPLNLELKEFGFEAEVLNAIKGFSFKVLISSKYPWILKKVRVLDESIQLGLILGSANWFLLPWIAQLDRKLKLFSVHLKAFLVFSKLVKYLKRSGKQVFVWTVHRPEQFAKLKALGVDGVFTDYPDRIKR